MDHLPYSSMYICIPGVCNDLQFILQLEKALKQNVHVLLLKQRLYKYKQVSFRKLWEMTYKCHFIQKTANAVNKTVIHVANKN